MSYIEVKNLSKTIGHTQILDKINFSIEKGTINGFTGANGSGKTMLFRALLGFIKFDGEIKIAQKAVSLNQASPVNTGAIIETPGFINNYSAFDNLKYLAAIKGLISDEEIIQAMSIFGLDQKKDIKVKNYSLGMRQKLAIIQAFMEKQELLVLDEPTNGLDDTAIEIFEQKMQDLAKNGTTILIASHDKDTISKLCDNVFRLNVGKLTKQ